MIRTMTWLAAVSATAAVLLSSTDAEAQRGRPDPAEMFQRMDRDNDGRLSKDEQAALPAFLQDRIRNADSDGNGSLTKEEIRASLQRGPDRSGQEDETGRTRTDKRPADDEQERRGPDERDRRFSGKKQGPPPRGDQEGRPPFSPPRISRDHGPKNPPQLRAHHGHHHRLHAPRVPKRGSAAHRGPIDRQPHRLHAGNGRPSRSHHRAAPGGPPWVQRGHHRRLPAGERPAFQHPRFTGRFSHPAWSSGDSGPRFRWSKLHGHHHRPDHRRSLSNRPDTKREGQREQSFQPRNRNRHPDKARSSNSDIRTGRGERVRDRSRPPAHKDHPKTDRRRPEGSAAGDRADERVLSLTAELDRTISTDSEKKLFSLE